MAEDDGADISPVRRPQGVSFAALLQRGGTWPWHHRIWVKLLAGIQLWFAVLCV